MRVTYHPGDPRRTESLRPAPNSSRPRLAERGAAFTGNTWALADLPGPKAPRYPTLSSTRQLTSGPWLEKRENKDADASNGSR
jgi:hypothetical protein